MTLKHTYGTFERKMSRYYSDPPDTPDSYTITQEARIYAKYFAVYKVGKYSNTHYRLDHIPTGLNMATGKRLKDCVAKIEALLQLNLPWSEPDPAKWTELFSSLTELVQEYRAALRTVVPYKPRPEPKPKEPAAYGTLASALEYHNSYCPYACAFRTLWEQDHFHKITKQMIEERIRLDLVEEQVNCYRSAQEAYDEIMAAPLQEIRFTKMGHPLNGSALKSLMRWAVAHKIIEVET